MSIAKNNASFKKKPTISLVCGLLSIFIVGCVSQQAYDEVVAERDALVKQNKSLSGNVKLARNMEEDRAKEAQAAKMELEEKQRIAKVAKMLYDNLVSELSSEVATQQITIEQMQSGVTVNLSEGVLFSSGSAAVSETGIKVLEKVGTQLKNVPYQTLVGGYTDDRPIGGNLAKQFPSNWELAAVRATNVVRKLESSGVPSTRLVAVSFGETKPVAPNNTVEGRAQNRRIEIRLRPVVIEE